MNLLKYTITKNLGNAVAHAHYHPCNEYQAIISPFRIIREKNKNGLGTRLGVMEPLAFEQGVVEPPLAFEQEVVEPPLAFEQGVVEVQEQEDEELYLV